ncbi:MAG: CoA transferase subunit A [Ardenticatenales bacterium]|nr:CoA transferase subunit A [Ardenticatenales bacterium]
MRTDNKQMTLDGAISRYVKDGSSVAIGMALEASIPFAAGHEIIRQKRHDLTLIGPISDMLFDQMIGAGCVKSVMAAWVGHVGQGGGHAFQRAVEAAVPRAIEMRDHSNFTLTLALTAGSLGVPFIPTQSTLGSELSSTNVDLIERINPLNELGEPLQLVRALHPDVAIIHVQRAAVDGAAHLWGPLGLAKEAALAARDVILTAEEIVPADSLYTDPNRIFIPPFRVSAVVEVAGGAHPAPVAGYYEQDHSFAEDYAKSTRDVAGMEAWLRLWVFGMPSHADYREEVGEERWGALRTAASVGAAPIYEGGHA